MKKTLAIGLTTVAVVAAGGVAWAALGGFVSVPDVVQGVATGGGGGSCQVTSVTFTVPTPTWDNTMGDYAVTTIGYSGITTQCVNLGTADLVLNLTNGGTQSLATATASNMSSASGTLTLSTAVSFDDASSGTYNYLVKDN